MERKQSENENKLIQENTEGINLNFITKLIEDYKYKTNDLGFTEKKALKNSYNANIGRL